LAKRFGAKQSAKFVNGVLDRFLQERERREEQKQPEDTDQGEIDGTV
jgi:hypothetical protein